MTKNKITVNLFLILRLNNILLRTILPSFHIFLSTTARYRPVVLVLNLQTSPISFSGAMKPLTSKPQCTMRDETSFSSVSWPLPAQMHRTGGTRISGIGRNMVSSPMRSRGAAKRSFSTARLVTPAFNGIWVKDSETTGCTEARHDVTIIKTMRRESCWNRFVRRQRQWPAQPLWALLDWNTKFRMNFEEWTKRDKERENTIIMKNRIKLRWGIK